MALFSWFTSCPGSSNGANEFFSPIEFWLVRALVFLLFVVGLGKVGWELMRKILR